MSPHAVTARFDSVRRQIVALLAAVLAVAAGVSVVAAGPAQAATPWTAKVVPNTTPKQPHAALDAVSCPSATFCLAVGTHVGVNGRYAPLAERFDGKAWHVTTTALAGADEFESVSCTDSKFCAATTSNHRLARWNGATWTYQSLGAHVIDLSKVVCRSHTFCIVVGALSAPGNNQRAASWHYTGKGWFFQKTFPSPANHILRSISCPSTTVCYAAGSTNASYDKKAPSVQRWNGKTWTALALPKTIGDLADISCRASTVCTAVGSSGTNQDHALVLDLAGGKWKSSTVATKHYSPTGQAVACTASSCTAILQYDTGEEAQGTSIAVRRKTGGFVVGRQSYNSLRGLSNAGTSSIVVGTTLLFDRSGFQLGDVPASANAFRRSVRTLVAYPVPQPDGRTPNAFSAISCSGALCAAVDQPGTSGSLWLRKTATASWQPVTGTARADYVDVSCTSTTFCMAVGQGRSRLYNGTSWTSYPIPTPDGKGRDSVISVSCVSPIWCEAVGTTGADGDEAKVFAAHWAGTGAGWTVRTTPTPAGSPASLNSISCTSTDDCLAVGDRIVDGGDAPVAAKFHDATWSLAPTTGLPADLGLTAVSCWAAGGCMVSAGDVPGASVLATWNGTTFTVRHPVGEEPIADAVSCTSASSCTIAGIYYSQNQYGSQMIEHWNGSTWHVVPTPDLHGDDAEFFDVTCTAGATCNAVGSVTFGYQIAVAATGSV